MWLAKILKAARQFMTFAVASQFHVYLPCFDACLAYCLNSVLNVKTLVRAFNKEKALISVIVKSL